MRYIITCLLYVYAFYTHGQISFEYDQSIPIKVDGENLLNPWAGGINSAQYNTADLNNDGIDDLILFDRTSNKVSTYLAEDNKYKYMPDYESYFPTGMTNWVIMRDYDCDGKKDIFTSSAFGITLYRNISEGGEPAWEVSADPVTTLGTGSVINLKVNGSDIPAIEDMDGDGDLDILMFGFNGGEIQYHQNFTIERTGGCGVPDFERITNNWGDFSECGCGVFAFKGENCRPSGGRELHVSGKSLLAYDMDGDGDMEVVIGEEDCNRLYLFENKGNATDPIIDGFVTFPNATAPVNLITFPAAFLEDINFDGKKDLLVSPNRSSNSLFSPSNFQKSSWMYSNMGSNSIPNFQFDSFNFLQSEMIDHGNNSSVAFVDEDGDGDLDMLVTSHGQVGRLTGYKSQISLYRNVGTKASPAFELENDDYLTFSLSQFANMKLQIADVNGDGKKDLVIATTLLNSFGYLVFYLANTSSDGLNFTDQQLTVLSGQLASFDNPFYFDIDKDGLIDLLVGRSNGNLSYFKNFGTSEVPDFQLETDNFYDIELSFTNRNLVPTVGDLDGDGNMELITTDGSGQLSIYKNFLNHLNAPFAREKDNYFNTLTENRGEFRLGTKTLPVAVDLYNSGTPVIVLGTAQGGLQMLKNTEASSPNFENSNNLLSVFPNPGLVNFNDGIIEINSKEPLSVRIISVLGKEIYSDLPITPLENLKLPIDALPVGMYLVLGERDGKIVDETKFVIVD